jgi:hypothetical protein
LQDSEATATFDRQPIEAVLPKIILKAASPLKGRA